MGILSNLEPKRVFEIFEEMCAIPHGSTNTKAISDWCVAFGEKLGLEHYQDEANNVILIAPATPGYEDAPAVILQGHVDMVCEKEAGCAKDMDKEGLDLFVDGDLVGAKGTTLGGDDGIAVAMALAALEDTTLQHPRLEVVLTTDEEIGMLGAAVLDVTPLQGRTMLNIDSEEEGIFTVGCAGGSSVFCHLPLIREEFAGETLAVRVSGLVGGHSGVEINKGRANADVLLGRLLRQYGWIIGLRMAVSGALMTFIGFLGRAAVRSMEQDFGLGFEMVPSQTAWYDEAGNLMTSPISMPSQPSDPMTILCTGMIVLGVILILAGICIAVSLRNQHRE